MGWANSSLRHLGSLPQLPPETHKSAKGVVREEPLAAAFHPQHWQQLAQQQLLQPGADAGGAGWHQLPSGGGADGSGASSSGGSAAEQPAGGSGSSGGGAAADAATAGAAAAHQPVTRRLSLEEMSHEVEEAEAALASGLAGTDEGPSSSGGGAGSGSGVPLEAVGGGLRAREVAAMLHQLQALPWRRIDVSFKGSSFGFAHNNIVGAWVVWGGAAAESGACAGGRINLLGAPFIMVP